MPEILHRGGINDKPNKVYEALTAIEGFRHGWTIETTGETKKGGLIDFGFCRMKVVESVPNEIVKWK